MSFGGKITEEGQRLGRQSVGISPHESIFGRVEADPKKPVLPPTILPTIRIQDTGVQKAREDLKLRLRRASSRRKSQVTGTGLLTSNQTQLSTPLLRSRL